MPTKQRARLQGSYLSGKTLFALAVAMKGYYWERRTPLLALERNYEVYNGNDELIGFADTPAEARVCVVEDFKIFIQQLVQQP